QNRSVIRKLPKQKESPLLIFRLKRKVKKDRRGKRRQQKEQRLPLPVQTELLRHLSQDRKARKDRVFRPIRIIRIRRCPGVPDRRWLYRDSRQSIPRTRLQVWKHCSEMLLQHLSSSRLILSRS